jgi:O-antigen/teichoic acid export membrane protein
MLDWSLARSMIAFALPLVPAAMAGWVLNLSDRPLLQAMTGDRGLVGVYTMGYTGGLVINALAIQPFTLAWGAAFWEVSRRDDAARVFARALTWFLAIAAGAALLLSGLGTDALRLLVGAPFEESRFIVPFSAFAYVLYGAYTVGASGLSVVGRSGIIAITMGIAALATLVLNILLIPVIGMFGAALSTLLGYLLLAIVAGAISQRHFPVAWELGRGATILLIAASLSAAALLGPDHVLWRIGCVIAYGPLLLGLGIVKLAQGRALLSVLRR